MSGLAGSGVAPDDMMVTRATRSHSLQPITFTYGHAGAQSYTNIPRGFYTQHSAISQSWPPQGGSSTASKIDTGSNFKFGNSEKNKCDR